MLSGIQERCAMAGSRPKSRKNEPLMLILGLMALVVYTLNTDSGRLSIDAATIQTIPTSYRETDDYETELRHFLGACGVWATIEQMQEEIYGNYRMNLIREHPEEAGSADEIMRAARGEAITLDEITKEYMPVYQRHFSIEEIQKLNRFYSNATMQEMVNRLSLLTKEIARLQTELFDRLMERLDARSEEIIVD
jgi:hypothetical protein